VTVELALLVSSDGIALVHRQPAGHWSFVGETAFDVPDLDAAMAELRRTAEERVGEKAATLLVLPDDQILYTSLTAPTDDPEMTAFRIEEGLEGMTPYAVSELAYDWRPLEADRVKLAVVAQETLDEARGFAETHGFNPAGFAAMPPQERFPGMPLFDLGDAAEGLSFPDEGLAFGPDTWGLPQDEDAAADEDAPGDADEDTGAEAEAPAADAPTQDAPPAPEAPAPGAMAPDAPETPSPEAGTDRPEPSAPDTTAPDAPPSQTARDTAAADMPPAPDTGAADTSPPAGDAAAPQPASPAKPAADEPPDLDPEEVLAAAAEDRAPDQKATRDLFEPPAKAEPPAGSEEAWAEEDQSEAARSDGARSRAPRAEEASSDPDAPPMLLQDPTLTSPVAPLDEAVAETETGKDNDPELPPAPSPAVLAARKAGATAREDDAPGFSSRGPDKVPARSEGGAAADRPAADAPGDSSSGEDRPRDDTSGATGKSRNPLAERLTRVRDAASRSPEPQRGVGAADKALRPAPRRGAEGRAVKSVLPPPSGGPSERKGRLTSLTASPGQARGGDAGAGVRGAMSSGLSGLLGRGRKPGGGTGPDSPRRGAATASAPGRLSALGAALRNDDTAPEPGPSAAPGPPPARASDPDEDTNITGGLLGRTPDERQGPSLRTGLLLTIVLLILLAAIAVWSALFLPDSPVARLLGGGDPVAEDAPALSGTPPPAAITAPPAIGELAPAGAPPGTLLDETTEPEGGSAAPATAPGPADEDAAAGGSAAPAPETGTASETETAPQAVAAAEPAAAPAAAPVPPLPPLPQEAVPSLEEARAIYEDYGIWPRPPERPDLASLDSLSDLGLSARDAAIPSLDAIALPRPRLDPTETVQPMPQPPPFGAISPSRAALLTEPTPEGAITAAGVRVTAGQPPVSAIPRPAAAAPPAPVPSFSIEDAILGTFRPAPRPGDLGAADAPQAEPPGTAPLTQRAAIAPLPRNDPPAPAPGADAAAASLFPRDTDDAATEPDPEPVPQIVANAAAVQRSLVPASRPSNIDALVAAATPPAATVQTVAVEPAAVAPGPAIPSSANVARAATQENVIRLRQVNLIGVTGTASERRALVRLPSGRFVRVAVGDRLDGGRVAAIGESTLQYVRSGRTVTLDIPG
jgi:hypothetical protein